MFETVFRLYCVAFVVGVSVVLRFVIVVLWDMSPLTRLSGLLMICVLYMSVIVFASV
jgi:hypothetical protein